MDELEFLTVKQVAARLKSGLPLVYTLIRNGDLPHYRFGRQIRIDEKDFEQYLIKSRKETKK